jgi:hypothetical protein
MITHLCVQNPVAGELKGVCVVCGQQTLTGYKLPFSDNFTGYSYLSHGDLTCPRCYTFFKTPEFRRKSWIASQDGVLYLKRLECRQHILNPPTPPFFLYITKTGQRQGWLSALKLMNYSQGRFYISTDWVGHFLVERSEALIMATQIAFLREREISKTTLLTGNPSMKQYRLAIEGGWEGEFGKIRKYVKQPLWEVMVYVSE